MKKLLAAWLCVALVACAMGGQKAAMAPSQTMPDARTGAPVQQTPPPPQTPEQKHDQIEQLTAEINEAQRLQLHDQAGTPMSTGSVMCKDICTLSQAVCDNTDKICKLADELQPDDWATGKCTDAKQSCSDAKKRCTDCGA